MNDDLISRKALYETVERYKDKKYNAPIIESLLASILCVIDAAPTVDAEPVRRGRWEWKEGAAYCTAHKGKLSPHVYGYAHCPWCGARMDGV